MATFVNDRWDPMDGTDELNLYEIYNEIYGAEGANFSSTDGATNGDLLSGGLDAMESNLEIFSTGLAFPQDGMVEFEARYAGFEQRIGYYVNPDGDLPTGDPTLGVDDGELRHLFDVTNPGNTVVPGPTATIAAADLVNGIGFYNNTPLGGPRTWYSETSLNFDNVDHLVVFRGIGVDAMGNVFIRDDEFIIAFEDRVNAGDMDFNDGVFRITIPQRPLSSVPEPATAGLLMLGLAGAAVRRRFMA